MKSSLLIAATLALLLSGHPASSQPRKTPAQPGSSDTSPAKSPAVQAWEYKDLSRPEVEKHAAKDSATPFASGLNRLGADGWELVAVDPRTGGRVTHYLFKRPAAKPVKEGKESKEGKETKQSKENKKVEDTPPVQVVRLKYATATSLAKTLSAVFRKVEGVEFVPDERTNSLLITGDLNTLTDVVRIITALDEPVEKTDAPKK